MFTRTKRGAHKITQVLKKQGHLVAQIHADRTLGQRKEALEGFRSGKYRILIATDIAARGIDVKGIELVINYDLPDDPENYVHRIGRAAPEGLASSDMPSP
jgi:ATP-dependent RNA helicase RhlE